MDGLTRELQHGRGRGMARRTVLLPPLMVAALLVACAAALLAVSKEAQATFPGHNGKIAYVTDGRHTSGGVLYTINPDGSGKTIVTEGRDPSYSSDGKKIAYAAYDGHDLEIYTLNAQGGGTTQLTNNNTDDYDPAYSPDGKKIVYLRVYDSPITEIYTLNVLTGARDQLTNNYTAEYEPSYAPDGKRIVYAAYDGHDLEIYTMNASGGGKAQLTNNHGHPYYRHDDDPAYSPDGKRIVYASSDGSSANDYEIYTMNASDGANKLRLTYNNKDDLDPAYSPDGKKIAYTGLAGLINNDVGGAIYTINVGGGGKFRVTDIPEDCGGCYYIYGLGELSWGSRP
jgi:Tol biopolymer transport system component